MSVRRLHRRTERLLSTVRRQRMVGCASERRQRAKDGQILIEQYDNEYATPTLV